MNQRKFNDPPLRIQSNDSNKFIAVTNSFILDTCHREFTTDTHDPVTKQRIRQTQKLQKCWIRAFQPLYRVPLSQNMRSSGCSKY